MAAALTQIRRMLASEVDTVLGLIMAGLAERWGAYDDGANPDLADFLQTYGESVVLVAVRERRLVGVAILHRIDRNSAHIVRMSVARDCRRQGIGTLLLNRLLDVARERGVSRIALETTASWDSAVSFYQQAGFVRTHTERENQFFEFQVRKD